MASKAKFKDKQMKTSCNMLDLKEGFYICDDDNIWEKGIIVYKDYENTLSAFGHGYVLIHDSMVSRYKDSTFVRVPDKIEIIVSN